LVEVRDLKQDHIGEICKRTGGCEGLARRGGFYTDEGGAETWKKPLLEGKPGRWVEAQSSAKKRFCVRLSEKRAEKTMGRR